MTLTLKSLNSAIEAMQAEIKATDNLNAKLAETIARLEAAEKQAAYFMREREAIVNYYRGPIQALSERLDTLEKRDAVKEAAKAIKGRVQAIWKAAKV